MGYLQKYHNIIAIAIIIIIVVVVIIIIFTQASLRAEMGEVRRLREEMVILFVNKIF